MERLLIIFYFLPAIVCMLWFVGFVFARHTLRQTLFLMSLAMISVYLISYAFFTMPQHDHLITVITDSIGIPLAFLMLASLSVYLHLIITGKFKPLALVMYIPAALFSSSLATLYAVIGYDTAADLMNYASYADYPEMYRGQLYYVFYFVDITVMTFLSLGYLAVLFMMCAYYMVTKKFRFSSILDFFVRGKRMNPTHVEIFFITVLLFLFIPVIIHSNYISEHTILGVVLSIVIALSTHIVCLAEYNHSMLVMTMERLRTHDLSDNILTPDGDDRVDADNIDTIAALERDEDDTAMPSQPNTLRERRRMGLLIRFRKLMEDEKVFLDADIDIIDVAQSLGVGKTTLSGAINSEYGKNFRAILAEKRIDYAKRYMQQHPGITQEEVAIASGFKDVTSYSHKFKAITGITPVAWLTTT